MKNFSEELKQLLKKFDVEFFLFESHLNNYEPNPPEGYFGMCSDKRHIFLKLNNGAYPKLSVIDFCIKNKQYIEQSL